MGALRCVTFLLGLTTIAFADNNCPPQRIDSQCTCYSGPSGTKVICQDIKFPYSLQWEIQNYRGYKIDVLILQNIQMPYLPAGLFIGNSVKELIIKDSVLEKLYSTTDYRSSPFTGLEDSLEEFAVYSTETPTKWFWPDMKSFKHLKKIEIVQSPLQFVGHVFAEIGEGSLESITVAYSNVYRIHPNAFVELSNLKEVNFRGNFLPYMARVMFPDPATQLKKIDLSDNKLFALPENMFDNMPALEFLDLSQNEFKTFQNMPVYNTLKSFYISNNPFECGCHIQPLQQLLPSSNLKYTDLEEVTCVTPGSYKKVSLKEMSFEKCN